MPIGKKEVLDILAEPRIRSIHFSVGPINVNHTEYQRVADHIAAGAVTVVPTENAYAQYVPRRNRLETLKADPPLDFGKRALIVHECTHIISDINKVKVTRLTDEVAGYLAHLTYMLLHNEAFEPDSLRIPLYNMMRQGVALAKKYKLGKVGGATVDQSDIEDFARAIRAVPEYSEIPISERLDADGVELSAEQKKRYLQLQAGRTPPALLNELIGDSELARLQPTVRGISYEYYVTWDPELLSLFNSFTKGADEQKKAAQRKLLHIFLTINQSNAMYLRKRLSSLREGDPVSARFQFTFPLEVRSALLSALSMTR